jgi:hypothetical protein
MTKKKRKNMAEKKRVTKEPMYRRTTELILGYPPPPINPTPRPHLRVVW